MPDQPDWYNYRLEPGRQALGDIGELAVRLGSVVNYDRAGTVLFADGMEYGTSPYLPQTGGTGAAVASVTSPTFQGGYSLKCTAGEDGNANAGIIKRIQPITLSKLGLEITFSLDTTIEWFQIQIQHNDGTNKRVFGIKIDTINSKIEYRNEANAWIEVQAYTLTTGDKYLFYTAKLLGDPVGGLYDKFYINQTEIDLSTLQSYYVADSTKARLEFLAMVNGRDGENDIAYLDNMVITANEP